MSPRAPLVHPGEPICRVSDLQNGQSRKFRFPTRIGPEEAFLIRYRNHYHAYVNRCRHLYTPLDYDDNDFFSSDARLLVCKTHGARYEPDTGACAGGPCDERALLRIPLEIRNAEVILGKIPAALDV